VWERDAAATTMRGVGARDYHWPPTDAGLVKLANASFSLA